jgi:hypothetical protein
MRPLRPALQFYIQHALDIEALEALGAKEVQGAAGDDWAAYQEVLTLATDQVISILKECTDRAFEALHGKVVGIGRGAGDDSVRREWSIWRGFRAVESDSQDAAGFVGFFMRVDGGVTSLVPHLQAKSAKHRPAFAAAITKALGAQPPQIPGLYSGLIGLAKIDVTEAADLEQLIAQAVLCVTTLGDALAEWARSAEA